MYPATSRDLRGYGERRIDPEWPNGAAVALNFVMNYEEGSERTIEDGDGTSERALLEVPESRVPAGERDLAAESMYEYGARVGFWRLRRLFIERNLPLTVFACAVALERTPEAAKAIGDAGWDICCHGLRWEESFSLPEEVQRDHIKLAFASLERTTGRAPAGWYCRYASSEATRRLLVEDGRFLYDSDAYNDELPYWVECAGRPHLVVPYSLAVNDTKMLSAGFVTAGQFFEYLKDTLDMLRAEGSVQASMMSVGFHLRIMGHPGRAIGLARFLDYAAAQQDVWICRRVDIASHWRNRFPPPTNARTTA
jgi:peptidoglycan/xylan/chitin deacetylase (PgdA/CDA1 family)